MLFGAEHVKRYRETNGAEGRGARDPVVILERADGDGAPRASDE